MKLVIAIKMVKFLENNQLTFQQYAFKDQLSTVDTILNLLTYASNTLENRQYCGSVFCDVRKAFNSMPHGIFLRKFTHYG